MELDLVSLREMSRRDKKLRFLNYPEEFENVLGW